MATTESTDGHPLRGPRYTLLEALVSLGGRAPTPAIEDAAVGQTGSAHYFLDRLATRDLVERDGKDYTANGAHATIFRATEAGERALAEESDRGDSVVTTARLQAENDALRDRVKSLETTVAQLEKTVNGLTPDDEGW